MPPLTRGYWVEAPGRGAVREVRLPAPGPDDVLLRTLVTGISPGTERLVGLGRVPATCDATMAVPGMQGSFALPILYGYSLVGEVVRGEHAGRVAFTMHPHQEHAIVPALACVWLPADVPIPRATLFANLETAQNAVWDAAPVAGETIAVIGGGAVGLLVAFVLATTTATSCTLVEADRDRRAFAAALPWVRAAVAPDQLPRGAFACALHASGTGDGLQLAIDAVGFEGRAIDLSWYGDRPVTLHLGASFHHQRKVLRSSQVGTIAPSQRAAGRDARTAAVLQLLREPRLDALLATPVPFASLPDFATRLYRGGPTPPCPVVRFGPEAGYPSAPPG